MDSLIQDNEIDKNSVYSSDHEEEELENILDWVDDYKNEESKYELFYKEPVENLKLNFIYVGINNEIECINESSVLLTNNILSKERLIELITSNRVKNNVRYNLKYLLKYNFFLEPSDIISYIKNKTNEKYLTEIKVIDDIIFSNTISVMQDLNSLLFIFVEKPRETTSSVKRDKSKIRNTKKMMEFINRRKTKKHN